MFRRIQSKNSRTKAIFKTALFLFDSLFLLENSSLRRSESIITHSFSHFASNYIFMWLLWYFFLYSLSGKMFIEYQVLY